MQIYHFSREILQQLGLWPRSPVRALPWRSFGENHPVRCKEDVRPIFWSMRPKSYVFRTRVSFLMPLAISKGSYIHSSLP